FQKGTIEHLAELIREQEATTTATKTPLVAIEPRGAKPPFFCVHPGSGEVLCYVPWSRYLGAEQPFYALQDPNLASEEEVEMPLEEMAGLYLKAVREVQPSGPYMLGGWSFGGHVAFEMAQQLKRQGEEVSLLVVIDTVSPKLVKSKFSKTSDAELLAIMVSEMATDSGKEIDELTEALTPLKPDAQLKYVYDYLVQHRELTTLQDYTLAYLYRALQVFKTRIRVQQAYEPQVYDGRITLFKATHRRDEARVTDPTLGWGDLSTEPVEIHLIPGTHATIALMPHAEVLCRRLRESIDKAARPTS
ncbi:MAG TPA: thioesterase domain-containing protein, partial [Pyrinomonadaceae bacterium]|nr:thioesterase domain-containing protein [Pyrinomonadaceae bacterium]